METIKKGSTVIVRGAPFGFYKRPAGGCHLGETSLVMDVTRLPDDKGGGVLNYRLSDHYYYGADSIEATDSVPASELPPLPTASICSVTRPAHYNQGNIECIDAMVEAFGEEAVRAYAKINAFKYLWRSEYKNGMEDLKKAIFYLTYASGTDPRKES